MRVSPALLIAAVLCGVAASFEYDPSTEVLMACRPSESGELACRMVDAGAEEEIAVADSEAEFDGLEEYEGPMDFSAQMSFGKKILSGLKMLISGKACGNTKIEGVDVSYCVKRHIKFLKVRYSATVTAMGVQASNREFGGSDTKSGKGAVERAVQNWAQKMGQPF